MLAGQTAAPSVSRSLTRRFLRQSAPVRLAVAAIFVFAVVTRTIFAAKIGVQLLHPAAATLTLPPSATIQPPTATSLPPSATSLPPTATLIPASPTATSTDTSTPIPPRQRPPRSQPNTRGQPDPGIRNADPDRNSSNGGSGYSSADHDPNNPGSNGDSYGSG